MKTSPNISRDKVAVVTGCASGIGRALAVELAGRGMALALADVDQNGLAETIRLLGDTPNILSGSFDVASKAGFDAFALSVWKRFGRADVIINNAGVAISGSVYELSVEEMARIMNVNFWGVVHGTKAFLPGLALQKSGAIVNVSSLYGLYGAPLNAAYVASKFAVRGFTETLRGEMNAVNSGVRIVTVYPGGVATNIAKRAAFAAAADHELSRKRLEYFTRTALTMEPQQAARLIVAGLDAGKERILIGRETYFVDALIRAFAERGATMINDSLRKRLPPELRGTR